MKYYAVLAVALLMFPAVARGELFDGLDVYYSFDNDNLATGGIHDASPAGRDGSVFDADASGTADAVFSSDVPSVIAGGQSIEITGADYVTVDSYTGQAGGGPRSISLWVKSSNTVNQHFVEWGTNSAGNRWTFRMEHADNQGGGSTAGAIRTEIQSDYRTTPTGNPVINDGEWHHIAQVYTNDSAMLEDVTMYIDGTAIPSYADNANAVVIDTISLGDITVGGSSVFTGRNVIGLLDEVGVWDRALSTEEVASLAAGAVIPEPSSMALLLVGLLGLAGCRRHN